MTAVKTDNPEVFYSCQTIAKFTVQAYYRVCKSSIELLIANSTCENAALYYLCVAICVIYQLRIFSICSQQIILIMM